MNGIAYLYKETNGLTGFSLADEMITNTVVTNGRSFTVNCSYSNITWDNENPDRFYLVFRLTNDISGAKTNTVFFKINNLNCSGPNGGIFTNQSILDIASPEARIDSPLVLISYVSNNINNNTVKQGDIENPSLILKLTGDDPDATNYLSYIDVKTNGQSTVTNIGIPLISLVNTNGNVLSSKALGVNGSVRLTISPPLEMAGTDEHTLEILFNVSGNSYVVHERFGLMITNGSFGFTDEIDDDFNQLSFITNITDYPSDYFTNVYIIPSASKEYDYYLQSVSYSMPESFTSNEMVPVGSFSMYMDVEDTNVQWFQGVEVETTTTKGLGNVNGIAYLYKENNGDDEYSTGDILLASNTVVNGGNFTIPCNISNISPDSQSPDQIHLVFKLTNVITSAKTNAVAFQMTNLLCDGP